MTASAMNQPQAHLASDTYVFSSHPKAVRKYRKQEQEGNGPSYWNIMFDPRVVRGNTYALNHQNSGIDALEEQKQREMRRKELAKKRGKQLQQQRSHSLRRNQRSPEPVDGRKHVELQTEQYLEEIADRIEEIDNCCQTDEFLERPPTPLFVPAKIGMDQETQIYEGELFDFDVEVLPIVEVLIGKTLEQALVETMEEEELANIRQQQRIFEEMRNAELMEMQRLEEKEKRHREEKEKRMKQERDALNAEKETADKMAARAFAQGLLQNLIPSVFDSLQENGYFCDPVEREIESELMPWMMDAVGEDVKMAHLSRSLLDSIIMQVVDDRAASFQVLDARVASPAHEITLRSSPNNILNDDQEVEVDLESENKRENEFKSNEDDNLSGRSQSNNVTTDVIQENDVIEDKVGDDEEEEENY